MTLLTRNMAMFSSGGDPIGTICLLSLAAVFIWVALGRKTAPLEITIEDGRVTRHRGLAGSQVGRVIEFLERDVALGGTVVVVGARDSSGVLRLGFRGDIDEGARQQIRNYLKMVL